jgi:hypothetical protein
MLSHVFTQFCCNREVFAAVHANLHTLGNREFGVMGWPVAIEFLMFRAVAAFINPPQRRTSIRRQGSYRGWFDLRRVIDPFIAIVAEHIV